MFIYTLLMDLSRKIGAPQEIIVPRRLKVTLTSVCTLLLFGDPPRGMAKYIVAGTRDELKNGAIWCFRYVREIKTTMIPLKRSRSQESL